MAFADPRIEAAETIARAYAARPYSSLGEMLRATDIDLICIATPHDLHVAQATEALTAGFDVFMDKPLALTPEDGRQLVNVARSLGRRLGINLNLLFHPTVIGARAAILAGQIGTPVSANAWSTGWLDLMPEDFRKDHTKTGGGAWVDAGPHLVYVLSDLMGPFTELKALPSRAASRLGGEDSVVAIGRFASGQVASMRISYSYRAPGSDLAWPLGWMQGVEINGTEGAVRLSVSPTGDLETWRAGQEGWSRRLSDVSFDESFYGAIADFLHPPDGERGKNVSAENSLRVLELMSAAMWQ